MFAAGDLFAECDARGRITFLTGAVRTFTGAEPEALRGRPVEELVREPERPLLRHLVARARRHGRAGPVRVTGAGGTTTARVRACAAVRDDRVQLAFLDLAPVDGGALDGLVDAPVLLERLRAILAGGREATLTLLDLDGIDRLDEDRGRRVREEVGAVLRGHALEDGGAARIDARHYAVVHAPGRTGEVLDDLRHVLAGDGEGLVGLNARSLDLSHPAEDLRTTAEALALALRQFAAGTLPEDARDLGRLLAHRMETTVERVAVLRRTLRRRAFDLVFQPIVHLADRTVHHYEALVRPRDMDPVDFVGLAEEVGLVAELDLAVLERVLEELRAVDAARHGQRVAVNVSARSLQDHETAERMLGRVRAAGIAPRQLLFEVTETFAARDMERLAAAVRMLREAGHEICVDDFGVGQASFAYLQALPVDFVKIDGSFTDPAPGSREETLLRAMLEACGRLRLRTVVERVEREEQAARLAALGADLGQGWLFGRGAPTLPLPEGAVRRDGPRARRRGAREVWA